MLMFMSTLLLRKRRNRCLRKENILSNDSDFQRNVLRRDDQSMKGISCVKIEALNRVPFCAITGKKDSLAGSFSPRKLSAKLLKLNYEVIACSGGV